VRPYPTAAVIGAGSSGIAAAKALHERDVPYTVFEASDRAGATRVFGNCNGMSAADFPMPKSCPDYRHPTQIAAYFDAYVGPEIDDEAMRRRYVASKRDTIRVDVDDHLLGVARA
jgi:cation diffusion facilitator CzcD-associated flavoprotein CzcO